MSFPARRGATASVCALLITSIWPIAADAHPALNDVLSQLHRMNVLSNSLAHHRHATALADSGRYAEAEAPARRSYELARANLGSAHDGTAKAQADLSRILVRIGKLDEAERLARELLASLTQRKGQRSAHTAGGQALLGLVMSEKQRFSEAQNLLENALLTLKVVKPLQPDQLGSTLLIHALNASRQGRLAAAEEGLRAAAQSFKQNGARNSIAAARAEHGLGDMHVMGARMASAEMHYREAIAILEGVGQRGRYELSLTLRSLVQLQLWQDRLDEAEATLARAHSMAIAVSGADSISAASSSELLGQIHMRRGRIKDADVALRSALSIRRRVTTPDEVGLISCLLRLADIVMMQDAAERLPEAEAMLHEAAAVGRRRLGPDHPLLALFEFGFGKLRVAQKRYEDAEATLLRAAEMVQDVLDKDHLAHAMINDLLASVYEATGRPLKAFQRLSRASGIVGRRQADASNPAFSGLPGELRPGFRLSVNRRLIDTAWLRNGESLIDEDRLRTTFLAAQRASTSEAADALAQMSARFSAGDNELAGLLRRSQDLSSRRSQLDSAITLALSGGQSDDLPSMRSSRSVSNTMQGELARVKRELEAVTMELRTRFPDYIRLIGQGPLEIRDVQRLLGEDEAMVVYQTGEAAAYAWAVTRTDATWQRLALTERQIANAVDKLRCGLDNDTWNNAARRARCQRLDLEHPGPHQSLPPFDLESAHLLYREILAPLEPLTRGKKLLIVPAGALSSLPFHVLVTEPPQGTGESAMRNAGWLIHRQATTVLPAVQSLRWLRTSPTSSAARPLIGFGAPEFSVPAVTEPVAGPRARRVVSPGANRPRQHLGRSATKAVAVASHRAGVDLGDLSRGLVPLPETKAELTFVASRLAPPVGDLRLGASANEAAVKKAVLAHFRIVYFATHALTAGEVKGLSEPALVLSLPATATAEDDGLLTASEIAQLQLDADWVVLSACNTAAANRPGAETLSGLARSFFYAGARALLVSHWKVDSDAAVRLTAGTFDALATAPQIGRGEALRRAMVRWVESRSADEIHPAYWAPFVVVGD
jgi:CHAT domain-containing protein